MRIILVSALLLAGCATSSINDASMNINPGTPRSEVINLLGAPISREFRNEYEALRYCTTGFATDEFVTVFLKAGVVYSMSSQSISGIDGLCSGHMPRIQWPS